MIALLSLPQMPEASGCLPCIGLSIKRMKAEYHQAIVKTGQHTPTIRIKEIRIWTSVQSWGI